MSDDIRKILVATDGSSRSRKAAGYGVELAKLAGAEIIALFVIDVISGCSLEECITVQTPRKTVKEVLVKRGEEATAYVEEQAHKAGLKVRSVIVEGNAADQILKTAREESADLIVMGTLGSSGISRFLIGSTAEKVVRHSPIPVLTVKK